MRAVSRSTSWLRSIRLRPRPRSLVRPSAVSTSGSTRLAMRTISSMPKPGSTVSHSLVEQLCQMDVIPAGLGCPDAQVTHLSGRPGGRSGRAGGRPRRAAPVSDTAPRQSRRTTSLQVLQPADRLREGAGCNRRLVRNQRGDRLEGMPQRLVQAQRLPRVPKRRTIGARGMAASWPTRSTPRRCMALTVSWREPEGLRRAGSQPHRRSGPAERCRPCRTAPRPRPRRAHRRPPPGRQCRCSQTRSISSSSSASSPPKRCSTPAMSIQRPSGGSGATTGE